MAGYEASTLSEWVRERPRSVVVLLSALILIACSAVALSRAGGASDEPAQEVLAQDSASPEPTRPLEIGTPEPVPSLRSPSATPSGTPTAVPSASVTATASAPVAPVAPVTTTGAPRPAPRPTTVAPTTAPPVTIPPIIEPPATTEPPADRSASVTVTNTTDVVASFRVNDGRVRAISPGQSATITFQVRTDGGDSYEIATILPPGCYEGVSSGLGVEPGGAYAVTVVEKNSCPSLSTPMGWPRA